MANPVNATAASPKEQPELAAIYDRLDALGNSLAIIDQRLTGAANRGLGAIPEPGQTTGNVKAVSDGAAAKINDQIDHLVGVTERIRDTTSRLERLV